MNLSTQEPRGDIEDEKQGEITGNNVHSDCILITVSASCAAVVVTAASDKHPSGVTLGGSIDRVDAGIIIGNEDSIKSSIGGGAVLGSGGGGGSSPSSSTFSGVDSMP